MLFLNMNAFGLSLFVHEETVVESLIFVGKMKKPNLRFRRPDGSEIILRHSMPCMFRNGYRIGKIYTINYSPRCSRSGDILSGKILATMGVAWVA